MHHIARAFRWTLGVFALALVLWSFYDVGSRTVLDIAGRGGEAKVVLTVLHWGREEEEAIVQAMIDAYMAEHPGVEVRRIHATDFDAKLKTMLAAGTPPDLFYLLPDNVAEFADTGMVLNLEPYAAAQRAAGEADWLDAFYPALMDAFRWDAEAGQTGPTGDLVAIPKDFTPAVMYINADLFRAAGYTDAELESIHRDGWTWGAYREAMIAIDALNDDSAYAGGPRIYGGVIKHWPDPMRNLLWTFGGSFFGDNDSDFTDVQTDSPASVACLDFIRKLRFEDGCVFNASGITESEDDLFRRGLVGALGPYGRWFTPQMSDVPFEWDVVPLPHAPGVEPVSFLFTVAWAVSAQTEHPEEATALLKSLCGEEGQRRTARLGLAMPAMQTVAESPAFLDTPHGPAHVHVFLDSARVGRLPQFPRLKQFNRILESEMKDTLVLDNKTAEEAGRAVESLWLNERASPLYSTDYGVMPWCKVLGVTGVGLLAGLAVLVVVARRERAGKLGAAEARMGWLFISPWIVGFLLFVIGPIILALLLSLTQWSAMAPLGEARFVGLDNYRHMAAYDNDYLGSLKVTVYYTLLAVPLLQGLALAVAVLLNVEVRGVALWRTVFFLPSVVTGVALVTLWIAMFDNERGVINAVISWLGLPAPDWFGQDGPVFAIPAIVIMSLWGVGGGMVIYLAGLKAVPASLYEAARIDGAGRVRQFLNVTLPMLSPLIFFNVVMGIIGSFQVFTQAYVITSSTGGSNDDLNVYVLNLYRHAFEFHNMGYASALAWVLFVLLVVLTAMVFRGSKNMIHYEGLRG
ncbi:MAG: extracellular solute-binding protein [Phycisphaerales bacterium JB063]